MSRAQSSVHVRVRTGWPVDRVARPLQARPHDLRTRVRRWERLRRRVRMAPAASPYGRVGRTLPVSGAPSRLVGRVSCSVSDSRATALKPHDVRVYGPGVRPSRRLPPARTGNVAAAEWTPWGGRRGSIANFPRSAFSERERSQAVQIHCTDG